MLYYRVAQIILSSNQEIEIKSAASHFPNMDSPFSITVMNKFMADADEFWQIMSFECDMGIVEEQAQSIGGVEP